MLHWQSDAGMFGRQHNYWFAGHGDRVFHIKRLSWGRCALIVSGQFHSVQGGSAGSVWATVWDAIGEAERIAERHAHRAVSAQEGRRATAG